MSTVAELEAKISQFNAELAEAKARGAIVAPPALKLDLGCGNKARRALSGLTKEKGWTGVDIDQDGADVFCDLGKETWPFPDNSVEEVQCSHMLEHVPGRARIHFFNELWRVLKPGAKAFITTPYWASGRAYGDPTHEWPPVCEMTYLYVDANWRKDNAPHTGFKCDFTNGTGYAPAPWLAGRNPEFVSEAIRDHKEAAQDMQVTLVCRK